MHHELGCNTRRVMAAVQVRLDREDQALEDLTRVAAGAAPLIRMTCARGRTSGPSLAWHCCMHVA